MKIALIGYGKMGKAIEKIATERGHEIALRVTSSNKNELTGTTIQQCDVAIEFTGPETAAENIIACLRLSLPVISGSTGWLHRLKEVEDICTSNNGTFLYASNFSIGVNLFFELNTRLAQLMAPHKEYAVAITETHHTAKKDAPSGTAITLAHQILKSYPEKNGYTLLPETAADKIPIEAIRRDPAPGTHNVRYHSATDDIEITHTAHSRDGFALGAVLAAEYAQNRKGVLNMQDVLGLK